MTPKDPRLSPVGAFGLALAVMAAPLYAALEETYRYYRFTTDATRGNSFVQMAEFELYYQGVLLVRRQGRTEADGGGGLAHPALLIGHRHDPWFHVKHGTL